MIEPTDENLQKVGITREEYDKLLSDMREKGWGFVGLAVHPDEQAEQIQRLESEIELYKRALTLAVTLPMGVIPHGDKFYTQMVDGVCM